MLVGNYEAGSRAAMWVWVGNYECRVPRCDVADPYRLKVLLYLAIDCSACSLATESASFWAVFIRYA